VNLYQKIVEVRKVAKGFQKDGKGFNYKYVTGDQVLAKIRDKMNELNLLLVPSTKVGDYHIHNYTTNKGKEAIDFIVKGEMSYTWINGDEPEERLTVDWAYYGQMDEISRAYGSALTYSERYFLLKCLGLPTDEDDPDAKDTSENKPTEKKSSPPPTQTKSNGSDDKLASEKQLKYIYTLVEEKNYTEGIKTYIKKNYNKDSSKELTSTEASELIKLLQDMQA